MEQQLSNLTAAILNSDLNLHKPGKTIRRLQWRQAVLAPLDKFGLQYNTILFYQQAGRTQLEHSEVIITGNQ